MTTMELKELAKQIVCTIDSTVYGFSDIAIGTFDVANKRVANVSKCRNTLVELHFPCEREFKRVTVANGNSNACVLIHVMPESEQIPEIASHFNELISYIKTM